MFRPIKWSSSGPSHRVTKSQKVAYTYGIPLAFMAYIIIYIYFTAFHYSVFSYVFTFDFILSFNFLFCHFINTLTCKR